MSRWLTRNWWGLATVVVVAALIGATITYPDWWDRVGYKYAAVTVPAGESTTFAGVRYRLESLELPELDYTESELPQGGRMAGYLLHRDRDGQPAALPDGIEDCFTSLVAGEQRWMGKSTPTYVTVWADTEGRTGYCHNEGPLVVAMAVPEQTALDAVDLHLRRSFDTDGSQPPPDNADLWTVIRFHTG